MKFLTALGVLCIISMQCFTEASASQPAYEGKSVIMEGDPLRIVCKIGMREPFALEWIKDDMTINLLLENEYFIVDEFIEQDAALQSILNVRHAETWHSGYYRCNKFSSHGHLVVVLPADADDGHRSEQCFKHLEHFELKCSDLSGEVEWEREAGVPLDANIKQEMVENHSILKIEKGKREHSGKYTCKNKDNKQNFDAQMSAVIITKFPASANVVEGEKYSLACEVAGTAIDLRIEWYNGEIPLTNNTLVESANLTRLVIHEIKPDDRGNYTCKASNKCGATSQSIYIRVVDKYAALWPFLGICVEVVVLCVVIFIYEKRRSKGEFDESDGEQNNDTKHVSNAKDSEVRQRK